MRNLTPEEIRRAVRGRWRWPARPVTVEGVSTDSRTAKAGELFVALRGEKFDGHEFLSQAASAGCVMAIVDRDAPLAEELLGRFAGGVIGVTNTLEALGNLARAARAELNAPVIAVTGSNGKTTVKQMIHHILSRKFRGRAGPRSYNNAIGVPLTIFSVTGDDEYVVCEIGSNALGEVVALGRIARPDVAVITSVGPAHLARLIDLAHVAAEKASLLGELGPNGVGVIWADSAELAQAARGYAARLIRFGQCDSADLRVTGYEATDGGGRFELNGRRWVDLPVAGRHNAVNALAAIAVAQRFGFDQDEAGDALADYPGQQMRLEPIPVGPVTVINDAYNANPASLAAAAEAMASFPGQRRVLIVGDMLELGPRSVELHRQAGLALAAAGVDLLVGVGELGRQIAAAAAEAGDAEGQVEQFASVAQAGRALPSLLKPGDVVLLKGSRGMGMERLVKPIRSAFSPPGRGRREVKRQRERAC